MKPLTYAAVLCLAVVPAAAAPAPAPKSTNKIRIVGVWELVKSGEALASGTKVEFTKDGKLTMTVSVRGKDLRVEGSYSVDDNKLKITVKDPGGKEMTETDTITKLTDKELHLKDDKGKTAEFKRKK